MKTRILVAEANSTWRDFVRDSLQIKGYQVETASEGPECLRKVAGFRPDLLILDLELPWGGGEGVVACMRESLATRGVPVILTSALTPPRELVAFVKPPVVRCLAKPFERVTLLESIFFTAAGGETTATRITT